MFTTDSLFFIVLFVIPGTIKIIFDAHISKHPRKTQDEKLRIAEVTLFSVATFALNVLIFRGVYESFISQESVFNSMVILFTILSTNIAASFVYCIALNCAFAMYINIRNFFSKKLGHAEYLPDNSAREAAFNIDVMGEGFQIITIIRDGVSISGALDIHSMLDGVSHGLTLKLCKEIEALLEWDSEQPEEKRIFGKEKYRYVDFSEGYDIIFYETDRYLEYCNNPTSFWAEAEAEELAVAEASAR